MPVLGFKALRYIFSVNLLTTTSWVSKPDVAGHAAAPHTPRHSCCAWWMTLHKRRTHTIGERFGCETVLVPRLLGPISPPPWLRRCCGTTVAHPESGWATTM